MSKSIFDSNSERDLFKRLKTYWSRYVDVFPQIPVRNVIGYENIVASKLNVKTINFLLKSSFDFVICEKDVGIPILVVEFDGLSGGFSRECKFFINTPNVNDPCRKLKIEEKLKICNHFQIPILVISYQETNLLQESGAMLTVLDVIIGDTLEKLDRVKNNSKYIDMLTDAYGLDGAEAVEMTTLVIDTLNEQCNPIKNKIRKITSSFPFWPMQIVFPIKNNDYLKGQFQLTCGLKSTSHQTYTKKLLSVDIAIRQVGIYESDAIFLFNTIGEYCLAKKAERMLGADLEKWKKLENETDWTEV